MTAEPGGHPRGRGRAPARRAARLRVRAPRRSAPEKDTTLGSARAAGSRMRLDDLDLLVGRRAHLLHRTARPADTDVRVDGVPEAEVLGEEALRVESTAATEAALAATTRLEIDPGAEPWPVARAPDERDLEPVCRRGNVSQQPVRPARERWDAPAGGEQQVEPAVAVEIREVRPAPP